MLPWMRKGNVPKREKMTHTAVTSRKASFRLSIFSAFRPHSRKRNPLPKVISSDIRKAIWSSSWK